jgi:hypothetical protein
MGHSVSPLVLALMGRLKVGRVAPYKPAQLVVQ